MIASCSSPTFCVILDSTAFSTVGTSFHTIFQFNIVESRLTEVTATRIDAIVVMLFVRDTTGEPNAVSPSTTTFHALFLGTFLAAFFVRNLTILSNSVSTKASISVLHSSKLISSVSCLFEAFLRRCVHVDRSHVSISSVFEATKIIQTHSMVRVSGLCDFLSDTTICVEDLFRFSLFRNDLQFKYAVSPTSSAGSA